MAGDDHEKNGGPIEVSLHSFGTCCRELKEAMSGEDFEPLITVGADRVLYMSVGLVDLEDEEPGMVDHPLFFCPFCGKGLQTADEVRARSGSEIVS